MPAIGAAIQGYDTSAIEKSAKGTCHTSHTNTRSAGVTSICINIRSRRQEVNQPFARDKSILAARANNMGSQIPLNERRLAL
jgi:hypothetical protein